MQAEFEACTKLNDVYECATAMEEAGIVDNPHTNESYHSLFAVWDGLEKVFSQADESLQAQLLAERDVGGELLASCGVIVVMVRAELHACLRAAADDVLLPTPRFFWGSQPVGRRTR